MMFKQYSTPPLYEIRTPHKQSYYPPTAYNPAKYTPDYAHGHVRMASYGATTTTYASPKLPEFMTRQETYSSPVQFETRKPTFVQSERIKTKVTRQDSKSHGQNRKTTPTKTERISVAVDDIDPVFYNDYSPGGTPPPPYGDQRHAFPGAYPEDRYESQKQSPPAYKTRPRANTTPSKPQRQPSTKTKKQSVPKAPPKATAKDAARAGIPDGYSLKNWDPTEEPILLLGSVFDANTLGKWIYDWTVFHHGAGAPMADHAGELWLGLIELASKMKRAEEVLPRVKRRRRRELLEDFLDEGDSLLRRLKKTLRRCEDYMWDAAKRENGGKRTTTLGANSGCAFVDSIFGRDRELEGTEKLMADMRYWTHRFNSLCEDILRYPRD